ncbi:hypothetical protein [Gynuella sp.]
MNVALMGMTLTLYSCNAGAEDWYTDTDVETLNGPLLLQTDDTSPLYNTRLLYGKNLIREYGEVNAEVAKAFPEHKALVALIMLPSGGSGCPAMFELIDMTLTPVYVSPQFGSCSDIPIFEYTKKRLRMSFPTFTNEERIYIYNVGSKKLLDNSSGPEKTLGDDAKE